MSTKVYILGAGASQSSGVPMMNNLIIKGYNWVTNPFILSNFLNYVGEKYNIRLENISPDNYSFMPEYSSGQPIEYSSSTDALSMIKLDKDYGIEKILEDSYKEKKQKIVTDFICATINYMEKLAHGDAYIRFIENKIQEDFKGHNVVIISFNYDQLLELGLSKSNGWLASSFSYCIDFTHKEYPASGSFKILKLHGSFNWLYCDTCSSLILPSLFVSFEPVFNGDHKCQKCKKPMGCLLVPPSLDKKFLNIFDPLWKEASMALSAASEISIIGYSFREADTRARELIRKGMKNNSNDLTLTIADPNHEKIYNNFIKDFFAKDYKEYENFESFVGEKR